MVEDSKPDERQCRVTEETEFCAAAYNDTIILRYRRLQIRKFNLSSALWGWLLLHRLHISVSLRLSYVLSDLRLAVALTAQTIQLEPSC